MRAMIATDFQITIHNGHFYFGSSLSTIIRRYYNAFGKLIICTRIDDQSFNDSLIDVTDMIEKVVLCNSQLKVLLHQFDNMIEKEIKKVDLVISRLPSFIGYRAADIARNNNTLVLAESMGCAWDAYWNHGLAGKAIAPYMFFKMKYVVSKADYAVYVTNAYLQKKYPSHCYSISASNVDLPVAEESVLKNRIRRLSNIKKDRLVLMTTAAVDVRYKGQEYVIKAIPILNKHGIKVKYYLVGGGNQAYLKQLASKLNVSDQVVFTGKQPLEMVFKLLDSIDIYIQPSLQEGLPRSVIEAMSRGCACIGARTAGIPELITQNLVVKRKSKKNIVNKILWYVNLKLEKQIFISNKNFRNAQKYSNAFLNAKRETLYNDIIENIAIKKSNN